MTLPSGGTVLAERRRGSPSFTVAVVFPFGSRNENSGCHGFCHFIEHMLFKGTTKHNSYELWSQIENTGGYVNGFTDRDSVTLYCSVPSADWRMATDLLAQMAFASIFPPQEFEKEKGIIRAEIRQTQDDVEEKAYDSLLARYWSGNPAAAEIAGTSEEVASISRGALVRAYADFFRPENAIFAISGSPDPLTVARVLDESICGAREAFRAAVGEAHNAAHNEDRDEGAGAGRGDGDLLPATTPIPCRFDGYHRADCAQVYYFEAFQLDPPFSRDDYSAAGIISSLLGEASTSRLFQKIREELGLAYTVQSSCSFSKTESLLTVQACTDESSFPRCRAEIDKELEAVFGAGFSEQEVAEARRRLAGSFRLEMEDPEFRIRRLVHDYLSAGVLYSLSEDIDFIRSTSRDTIEAFLARLEAAPHCSYAYGRLNPKTAQRCLLKEI